MINLDMIRTLADIPAAQARTRGDAVAVKFGTRETSFAQLDARSNRMARALISAGVVPGDRVSGVTKNHDGWYPLFFGTARARACLAPVNCRLAAGEIAFILGDAGPKLLFVGEDFFEIVLAAVADGKVSLIAGVTADQTGKVKAGELVNFVAQQVGGKGGGRPDMAQAGGTQPENLPAAPAPGKDWVAGKL